jgi:hypothetical protein
MVQLARVVSALVVAVVTIAAAHADERPTKQEIQAASAAALAALPKADPAKSTQCKALPTTTGKEVAAAAACFRQAGAVGIAITFWREASQDRSDDATAMDAALQLGPAYEAVGEFGRAALAYESVVGSWPVTKFGAHLDGKVQRDLLVRAMCIHRQLAMDTEARANHAGLEGYTRAKPIDAAATCAALRPIRVPGR